MHLFLISKRRIVLAPPAIFLLDGPSKFAPPITVTIVATIQSIKTPVSKLRQSTEVSQVPLHIQTLDTVASFVVLPWGVVGFWRGFWLLMDNYLWLEVDGASEDALHRSMGYSLLIGIVCLFLGSEDVVRYIPEPTGRWSRLFNELFGRGQTIVLAIGAVNFWRCVWYIWDEFLGQTSAWSSAISHVIGVIGLVMLGAMSCITAPPSTLGVDAVADPEAADEPLFHSIPIPTEAVYFLAILRNPTKLVDLQASVASLQSVVLDDESIPRTRQTSAARAMLTRQESQILLTDRHSSMRQNDQFFRSR